LNMSSSCSCSSRRCVALRVSTLSRVCTRGRELRLHKLFLLSQHNWRCNYPATVQQQESQCHKDFTGISTDALAWARSHWLCLGQTEQTARNLRRVSRNCCDQPCMMDYRAAPYMWTQLAGSMPSKTGGGSGGWWEAEVRCVCIDHSLRDCYTCQ
jgi:hypothetical protein